MKIYLNGSKVFLSVDLTGMNAERVAYRLVDQKGNELIPKGDFVDIEEQGGKAVFSIEIPGQYNVIDESNQREVRLIDIYVETSHGTVRTEELYALESETVLLTGVNSFQTYPEAVALSLWIPDIEGFEEADKDSKIAALVEARRQIAKLKFRYAFDTMNYIFYDASGSITISDITDLSPEQFNALPEKFRKALCVAQVLQANDLLSSDETKEIRTLIEAGVTRSEVYEAKQTFGSVRPASELMGVGKRAMQELAPYVWVRRRLTRA